MSGGYGSKQLDVDISNNRVLTSNLIANNTNINIGSTGVVNNQGPYNYIIGDNLIGLQTGLISGATGTFNSSAFSVYGSTAIMVTLTVTGTSGVSGVTGLQSNTIIGVTGNTYMFNVDSTINKSTFSDEVDKGYFLSDQYMLESACLPFNSTMVGATAGTVGITSAQTVGTSGLNWNSITLSASGQYQTAVSNGGGIWYSSDYGHNWTISTTVGTSTLAWSAVSSSASGQYQTSLVTNGGIWHSSDYGNTWKVSTTAGTTAQNWFAVSVSASGQYQSAVILIKSIWYSSNYGLTWTQSTTTGTTAQSWTSISVSASGQYQTAVISGISPNIWYSSDYGHTWNKTTITISGVNSVSISSSGQYQVLVSANASIWYSSDFGHTWFISTTPGISSLSWQSVSTSSSGQYQVAISTTSTWYSYDYGQTWTQISTNSGTSISLAKSGSYFAFIKSGNNIFNGIIPVTTNIAINGNAYKTTGANWIVISDKRLKNISSNFSEGLNTLLKIPIKNFSYKNDPKKNHVGVIAQDVNDIYPACVEEKDDYYYVNTSDFIYLCFNSIKEQRRRIENQEKEIKFIKKLLNI